MKYLCGSLHKTQRQPELAESLCGKWISSSSPKEQNILKYVTMIKSFD